MLEMAHIRHQRCLEILVKYLWQLQQQRIRCTHTQNESQHPHCRLPLDNAPWGRGSHRLCICLLSLQLSIFQLLYVIRSPHDLANGKPLDARKSLQIAVNCELSTSNLDFDFNLNSYF